MEFCPKVLTSFRYASWKGLDLMKREARVVSAFCKVGLSTISIMISAMLLMRRSLTLLLDSLLLLLLSEEDDCWPMLRKPPSSL